MLSLAAASVHVQDIQRSRREAFNGQLAVGRPRQRGNGDGRRQ